MGYSNPRQLLRIPQVSSLGHAPPATAGTVQPKRRAKPREAPPTGPTAGQVTAQCRRLATRQGPPPAPRQLRPWPALLRLSATPRRRGRSATPPPRKLPCGLATPYARRAPTPPIKRVARGGARASHGTRRGEGRAAMAGKTWQGGRAGIARHRRPGRAGGQGEKRGRTARGWPPGLRRPLPHEAAYMTIGGALSTRAVPSGTASRNCKSARPPARGRSTTPFMGVLLPAGMSLVALAGITTVAAPRPPSRPRRPSPRRAALIPRASPPEAWRQTACRRGSRRTRSWTA